jgi:hypothetical protein
MEITKSKSGGLASETPFQGVTASQPSNFQSTAAQAVASLDFRDSTFAIGHFTYDSPHETRSRASAHFKKSPAHGAIN